MDDCSNLYDAEPVSARIVPNEVDGQVATIPRNVNGWGQMI